MNKRTTCCFTGHRPHKAPLLVDYANPRYKELENAVALPITGAGLGACRTATL